MSEKHWHLTSFDVIIINATVIVGLLILLSFQSTSSPLSISVQITERMNERDQLFFEFGITKHQVSEYEKILERQVEPEELDFIKATYPEDVYKEILKEQLPAEFFNLMKAHLSELKLMLIDIGSKINITDSETKKLYGNPNFVLRNDEIESRVKTISVFMIIPFTISAAWESVNAYRKKESDTARASKWGVVTMVIGFGSIIGGLLSILYLLQL